MKYVWRMWYWMFPEEPKTKSAIILQFCRKEGVMWQDVTKSKPQSEDMYW